MLGDSGLAEEAADPSDHSRFTHRDLRLLGQSSVHSPLRVIALIDFDCFYAQCEAVRLGLPEDQPLGVQQFKHVIAINYPARAAGLKKVVTAIEAEQKCPGIVLQHVPTWREGDPTWRYRDDARQYMDSDKSSLDYYRLQSRRAIAVIKDALPESSHQRIEKASIDEIFLDLSAQVHGVLIERYPQLLVKKNEALDSPLPRPWFEVLDWHDSRLVCTEASQEDAEPVEWDDVALNVGAELVRSLRNQIYKHLRYTCSAGIACNKILAKLAAGHNKPNKQTVIRSQSISAFLSNYKLTKLRGLGGKLGQEVTKAFNADLIRDLLPIPLPRMQSTLGSEAGLWVFRVIRGTDYSEITPRTQIQSMLSAKTFSPSITGIEQAERWLRIFAADIVGRLEDQEGRRPKTLAVHHQIHGRFGPTRSKQTSISLGAKLDAEHLVALSRDLLLEISHEGPSWPCLTLSISVSDFSDVERANQSIKSFLTPQKDPKSSILESPTLPTSNTTRGAASRPKKRFFRDFEDSSDLTGELQLCIGMKNEEDTSNKKIKSSPTFQHESLDDASSDGKYLCPTCTQSISAADVLEHLDWHAAVELQEQG